MRVFMQSISFEQPVQCNLKIACQSSPWCCLHEVTL